jgi:hypothetical protein
LSFVGAHWSAFHNSVNAKIALILTQMTPGTDPVEGYPLQRRDVPLGHSTMVVLVADSYDTVSRNDLLDNLTVT